jgi:hypothetical protein
MQPTNKFQFYDKKTYFQRLILAVDECDAGDRVLIGTMNFDPRVAEVSAIAEAAKIASKRGAVVAFWMDAHDFMITNSHSRLGPLWSHADFPHRLDVRSAERLRMVQELRAAGITFAITNQPHKAHTSPFSGRSHIKTTIINDQIYLGGCNMNSADHIDIMVSWRDKLTADWLYELLMRVVKSESTCEVFGEKDIQHLIDTETTLFIDAGVRKQSIILEQALQLIYEAKERLLITCQYFPHGVTADHLQLAVERGVDVQLVYNRPSRHGSHAPIQQTVIWQERIKNRPAHFFQGALSKKLPYIHAKVIASESAAFVGSHNYIAEGVRFGTAEIALLRRDRWFAREVEKNILGQIEG